MFSYSLSFTVTINDTKFLFNTSASTIKEAAKELVSASKLENIPDMWFKCEYNFEISDTIMMILSSIFQIKHITIGGLFYNYSEKLYGQDVSIHGKMDRFIFTEEESENNLKRQAAEWFMDKYPEYLI